MSAPQRPELADELRRRAEADQQARSFLGPDNEPTDAQIRHCQAVDADNMAWLAAIVTEHGWPGIRLVGEQGARAEPGWIGIDGDVRLAPLADPQRVNEFRVRAPATGA